jgi:hypothetical protein
MAMAHDPGPAHREFTPDEATLTRAAGDSVENALRELLLKRRG